jgi:uncharacterized damage-inducible protein DinB
MPMNQMLLPEFDHEMALTRKTLERVPEDKFGWKPHEKSMSLGKLASHVAEVPSWLPYTLDLESFDVAPPGQPPFKPADLPTRQAILDMFDANVKAARESLAKVSDEALGKNWSLLQGGKAMFTMPRAVVLRSFILNHNVHHRAQLGVYLRMNNVPVPALYGPSADEQQ